MGMNQDQLEEKLTRMMEEDNLFCDESITIKKLAVEMHLTPHQLSEFLNTRLNMNFKKFINHYRIKDAKRLLREEPELTVIAIAFSVGFNSQSAFYKAFSLFVGTTPTKYRKGFI